MALDLATLGAYTRQSIQPLLTSAIFGSKFQEMVMSSGIVLTGVKSSESIPIMDTDAYFQAQSCSFDPSGTTSFTQRTVTVGKVKVEEKLCINDLEAFFTQEALKAGSTYEDFTNAQFESKYLNRKNERIANQMEVALWQGNTASSTHYLKHFDGLVKLIDAGTPVNANDTPYVASTISTITSSNVLSVVKAVKNAIPAALKGDKTMTIFCGYDVFDLYVDAGVAANYFHYDFNDKSNYGGINVPGTGIRLEAVHGLDGLGDLYAFRMSNVAMGVDAENEESNYRFWYSQDNDDVRFRTKFKAGINVAFTSECVKFKSAL